MAAKIKKGDKVVVLAGRDRGRNGEVIRMLPAEQRALVRGVNMVQAPSEAIGAIGGRHHLEGSSHPSVEPCHRRSEGRQGDARGLQDSWMTAARFVSPSVPEI